MVMGLLMYLLSEQSKVSEIGRIMFFCALLALCLGAETLAKALHLGQ